MVPRNKKWFSSKIKEITDFWNIILKERVEGYEHRKPKKREKKPKKDNIIIKINTSNVDSTLVDDPPLLMTIKPNS